MSRSRCLSTVSVLLWYVLHALSLFHCLFNAFLIWTVPVTSTCNDKYSTLSFENSQNVVRVKNWYVRFVKGALYASGTDAVEFRHQGMTAIERGLGIASPST